MTKWEKLKRVPSWCVDFSIALITAAFALIGLITLLVVAISLLTGTCVSVYDYTELCLVHGFEPEGSPP